MMLSYKERYLKETKQQSQTQNDDFIAYIITNWVLC